MSHLDGSDEGNCKSSYLKHLSKFYIDSFNYVIHEGLKKACLDMNPLYTKNDLHVKISINDVELSPVEYAMKTRKNRKKEIYPSEARMRSVTYFSELCLQLKFELNGLEEYTHRTFFVPLMLKSDLCFLKDLNDDQLKKSKEDINDPGGYFIIKGKERLIRQFVVPRRNYPLGLKQNNWQSLGIGYSEYGILVSSVKDNHSRVDISLHYVNTSSYASVDVRIFYQRRPFFIPLMLLLKSLVDETDASIVSELTKFRRTDINYRDCIIQMIRSLQSNEPNKRIISHQDAKCFIGRLFLPVFRGAPNATFNEVTDEILKSSVLIHLSKNEDKFQFLGFCLSKLFSIVAKECKEDDIDNPAFQEVLTPGQMYIIAVKEGVQVYLNSVKSVLERKITTAGDSFKFDYCTLKISTNSALSFTPIVQTMLATGNIPGRNHGLMSETGYTISVKRTNIFEVIAQFAGIHKFSMAHYSDKMRKFYPEVWGFLCPAQTPEGENCGLYNYLAKGCEIVQLNARSIDLDVLYKIGVNPFFPSRGCDEHTDMGEIIVCVDGAILGWVRSDCTLYFLQQLKSLRSISSNLVPSHTEIVYISKNEAKDLGPNLFPGIYIFSSPCRMVRKVYNVVANQEEFLGCLEQLMTRVFLKGEMDSEFTESCKSNFLGFTACTIPFGEYNPGTRNIRSASKCKQAVSFPFTNSKHRSDTKSTILTYPQSPLVLTGVYADHNLDDNPMGTNVCIAVLSYTGFDMEDSIVLSKAGIQRGLMRDLVYETVTYDFKVLAEDMGCKDTEMEFMCDPNDPYIRNHLDEHGMPHVGTVVIQNSPILSIYYTKTRKWKIITYSGKVKACVESVRLMAVNPGLRNQKALPVENKKLAITYRIERIPEIGDKFSNRHGQKGICSFLMSPEDMPFSADGSIPDVIFNPHGLPSRMSIGMVLEIMSAKSAVAKGTKHIIRPFEFSEKNKAVEKFGSYLQEAGLHYYGTQKFYSGISGEELEADVFCGSVYYFRLSHVVEEKFQGQSVGEVDPKTLQPVNLNRVGAIRFGDMERDAILSHGAMSLTLDRLLYCSDKCEAYVCSACKLLISPVIQIYDIVGSPKENTYCHICDKSDSIKVQIPFVLVYLMVELSAIGVHINFHSS